MNAKQWIAVIATAMAIPTALTACARQSAPVSAAPGPGAYWESELPREQPAREQPARTGAEAVTTDGRTGDTSGAATLAGKSDPFLWQGDAGAAAPAPPEAQVPLRSHGPEDKSLKGDGRTEPIF